MRACPDTWPNFDAQYLDDRPIRAHHQIARLYLGYRGGFRAIKSPRADRPRLKTPVSPSGVCLFPARNPARFAPDSPLEEGRFELSVPPRWRTQLARRFTRYRRGMTTVDTSAADPEIRWHGPFGRVSLR